MTADWNSRPRKRWSLMGGAKPPDSSATRWSCFTMIAGAATSSAHQREDWPPSALGRRQSQMPDLRAVRQTNPLPRTAPHFSTVAQYQAEYRGVVEYYQLACNVHSFARLKWVMERSSTTTLAGKHRTRVSQIYKGYFATLQRPEGSYKGLRVVIERGEGRRPLTAEWGGIPLRRRKDAVLENQPMRGLERRNRASPTPHRRRVRALRLTRAGGSPSCEGSQGAPADAEHARAPDGAHRRARDPAHFAPLFGRKPRGQIRLYREVLVELGEVARIYLSELSQTAESTR